RTLALVAIATGAEHHVKLVGRVGAERGQRRLERHRLMRVVDEDRGAIVLTDELEAAARALELVERLKRLRRGRAGGYGQSQRHESVGHLERAGQRQM